MSNYKSRKMMVVSAAGFFILMTLCLVSISSAENYIGIILDGYQKDCIVLSNGEEFNCMGNRQLYAGDKVTKKPDIKALKIKWAPYTAAKELDTTSLTVVFEPPKDKKGIVQTTRELLGLVRTGHTVSIGATRHIREVVPQPGDKATLIPEYKSTFAWESHGGKYIVFNDGKSMEIFRKELKSESFLRLSPEEIGMTPGEMYTWSIITNTGNGRQFKVRLLSSDVAQQVAADLQKIEKEAIDNVDKSIQTALYLQFMSDAYPQDIDLYWLSYLVVETIKNDVNLKTEDKGLLEYLRKNYLGHVRKTS